MSANTGIEWTDRTWNPVTGCSKVSAGCKNCYAEREFARMSANPKLKAYFGRKFTDVACHPERLDAPLHWRKPSRIFVNSMSDLFHPAVPDEFICRVWLTMGDSRRHTYQILTKRPERMRDFVLSQRGYSQVPGEAKKYYPYRPLPNVRLGVSVEDQKTADERIPILLQTPAAIRFLSVEPLLGPVNICAVPDKATRPQEFSARYTPLGDLDWVIVGGESGPNARPCNIEHIRAIVRQCKAADVRCFVKQVGAWAYDDPTGFAGGGATEGGTPIKVHCRLPLRDRKGGDPAEWPDDVRIREYPRAER